MNYNPLLYSLTQIFDGYTRFDFYGQTLFFRHSSLKDQGHLNFVYDKFFNIALSRGIETKEQIYKRLIESNDWSEDEDLKIAELEQYISNLKKTKEQIFLPSQKEKHQSLIDEEEKKLNILLEKKNELVSTTAETFASKMCSEEFIRLLIYKDENLSNLKFSQEEFGELSIDELNSLNRTYFNITKEINEETIQQMVLEDFFGMYISLCENPESFFGKPIASLSAFQLKLLLYGRVFNNIFQNNDDIPSDIRKNPDELFKFVDRKRMREKFQNNTSEKDGTMVFGATREDLDILDPSARKISLSDQIAKNGGSLNMEDMIKLMGQ